MRPNRTRATAGLTLARVSSRFAANAGAAPTDRSAAASGTGRPAPTAHPSTRHGRRTRLPSAYRLHAARQRRRQHRRIGQQPHPGRAAQHRRRIHPRVTAHATQPVEQCGRLVTSNSDTRSRSRMANARRVSTGQSSSARFHAASKSQPWSFSSRSRATSAAIPVPTTLSLRPIERFRRILQPPRRGELLRPERIRRQPRHTNRQRPVPAITQTRPGRRDPQQISVRPLLRRPELVGEPPIRGRTDRPRHHRLQRPEQQPPRRGALLQHDRRQRPEPPRPLQLLRPLHTAPQDADLADPARPMTGPRQAESDLDVRVLIMEPDGLREPPAGPGDAATVHELAAIAELDVHPARPPADRELEGDDGFGELRGVKAAQAPAPDDASCCRPSPGPGCGPAG
jgi:hypothetical protein